MTVFKKACALAVVLMVGATAHAQTQSQSQAAAGGSSAGVASAASDMTEAEVRKVDKDTKKITLKHGAIKNLDMPAMTMVFHVGNASLLDKVQVGDKVRFKASGDDGKYTITDLQPAN